MNEIRPFLLFNNIEMVRYCLHMNYDYEDIIFIIILPQQS